MQIIRVFVCAVVFAIVGCGGAGAVDADNDTAEQSQAVTSTHTVANGSVSIPTNSTRFCRAQFFQGVNGHAGSPTWPNGHPKHGAGFESLPPAANAFPYSIPAGGYAAVSSTCNDFSDFGFGPGAYQSGDAPPFYLLWGPASGQGPVGTSVAIWHYPSGFCYLSGVNGLSQSGELAYVFPWGSGASAQWYLHAAGTPTIGDSAKCVVPDRLYTVSGPYAVASGGLTVGPSAANSFCAFTRIAGNLDDGWVRIRSVWGVWVVEAGGAVSAEMTCAVF